MRGGVGYNALVYHRVAAQLDASVTRPSYACTLGETLERDKHHDW
jgi:hypothetical protein